MSSLYKYRIYCTTDAVYRFWYLRTTEAVPTTCPDNTAHTIDSTQTVIVDSINTNNDISLSLKNNNLNELVTTKYDPIIQNSFAGNIINSQLYSTRTENGATLSVNENAISITLSTTTGSFGLIQSKKVIKYSPGYTIHISGAVIFDTPVAGSRQFFGVFSNTNDILVGYEGTDFVARYARGGVLHAHEFEITNAASGGAETATITLNGTGYSVSLTNAGGDTEFTASEIALGNTYGDLWDVQQAHNVVTFIARTAEARNGAYSFSSATAEATLTNLATGVAKTITNVALSSWNGDSTLLDSFDPTNNNMYEIEYSWYGAGNFNIRIFNPFTQKYENGHTFTFANQSSIPSLSNPNMYLTFLVESVTSTTAISTTFIGSFAAYFGERKLTISPRETVISIKNFKRGTETNLLTLRTRKYLNDVDLKTSLIITRIFASNESNRSLIIRVYLDPDTIGAGTTRDFLNYQFVRESDGFGLVDTTSETFTGGNRIYIFNVAPQNNIIVSFTDDPIQIDKEQVFLITGEFISGNNKDAQVSVSYYDFF